MENAVPEIAQLVRGAEVLLPELALAVALFLVLIQDLVRKSAMISASIVVMGALVSLVLTLQVDQTPAAWNSWIHVGGITVALKWMIGISGILTVLMGSKLRERPGEYYILLTSILLGGYLAVSANHLLLMVVGLELISIPSYILAGFRFQRKSAEAAIKYFLFGAAATAIMIYGISLLYGITTEFSFAYPLQAPAISLSFYIAATLVMVGLLFKIAVFPMHLWLPDVYEEAPVPVIALFSVVPKIAGLILLGRMGYWIVEAGGQSYMTYFLGSVAIFTMIIGNTAALGQDNAKRMLGYSSIAHGGFLLLGFLTFTPEGVTALMFYLGVYVLLTYGIFALVNYLENSEGNLSIRSMAGWGSALPLAGVLFVIHLIGLTGLPPTSGFTAKFVLFSTVYSAYGSTSETFFLVVFVIAVLNALISLFFYLKIPFNMFLKRNEISTLKTGGSVDVILSLVTGILVIYFFFSPGVLIELFNNANFAL